MLIAQSSRLLIRTLSLDDASFMYSLLRSKGWLQFIGDRQIKTLVDAERYIQSIFEKEGFEYYVIVKRNHLTPIGVLSFIYRTQNDEPDFGFALLPEHQKQGFAYEASQAFLAWRKTQNPSESIIAITKKDNEASLSLLAKLGFRADGTHVKDGEELRRERL